MISKQRPTVSPHKTAYGVCLAALTLTGVGLLVMYLITGYHPLLLTALIQLLPVLAQLILLLPAGKLPEPLPEAELPEDKKARRRLALKKLLSQMQMRWFSWRNPLAAILIGLGILAAHILFWKFKLEAAGGLNYLYPVLLIVGFVLTIVLEKWSIHAASQADAKTAAGLRSLISAMSLIRIAYIISLAAMVLKLLEIYDALSIVHVLLGILFVYESAMLAFSVTVRLIRKELASSPELAVSFHGMGKDMNILTYLEQNTGITMRSLWSLQLVKQLLPGALLCLVLVLWLSTGVVQIEAYQEGALFRLGKLQEQTLRPGFHLTLPWPLDQVDVYNTNTISKMSVGYVSEGSQDNIWTESHGGEEYRLLLGGGTEIVSINLIVEYRINDLMAYIKTSASPESLMQAQAYEIITARTIATDLDTLLAADRSAFSATFRQELSQRLEGYALGIEVVNVVLESIHPPVEIAYIYQDLISAGIDAEYLRLYAQNSANYTIMNAKEEATKLVAQAQADQFKLVGEAQASVTEFMAAAAADGAHRDAYRFHKYIQALTKAYGGAKLVIAGTGVDTKNIYIGSLTTESSTATTESGTNLWDIEGMEDIDEYDDDADYDIADPI